MKKVIITLAVLAGVGTGIYFGGRKLKEIAEGLEDHD